MFNQILKQMKKSTFIFVIACIAAAIYVEVEGPQAFMRLGCSAHSKEDTVQSSVAVVAEGNVTSEQQRLAQLTGIASFERHFGRYYAGTDLIGCASTEFGVVCPTCDFRVGADFKSFRLEGKVGSFTRCGVKTTGFDPQFTNFTIVVGEGFSVSDAAQLSLITDDTKVYIGHKGSSFYKFGDGYYFAGAEHKFGRLSLGAGMDFAEEKSGCAALKWSGQADSWTATASKIGLDSRCIILSYTRDGIIVRKGVDVGVSAAIWHQSEKTGLHVVTGVKKGSTKLFAQLGGYRSSQILKPTVGLGVSYAM